MEEKQRGIKRIKVSGRTERIWGAFISKTLQLGFFATLSPFHFTQL